MVGIHFLQYFQYGFSIRAVERDPLRHLHAQSVTSVREFAACTPIERNNRIIVIHHLGGLSGTCISLVKPLL